LSQPSAQETYGDLRPQHFQLFPGARISLEYRKKDRLINKANKSDGLPVLAAKISALKQRHFMLLGALCCM
jgi:hypothetical protein